eukprot:3483109-Pyramimonas_sp.AAC.1
MSRSKRASRPESRGPEYPWSQAELPGHAPKPKRSRDRRANVHARCSSGLRPKLLGARGGLQLCRRCPAGQRPMAKWARRWRGGAPPAPAPAGWPVAGPGGEL